INMSNNMNLVTLLEDAQNDATFVKYSEEDQQTSIYNNFSKDYTNTIWDDLVLIENAGEDHINTVENNLIFVENYQTVV
ncbi:13457_t:CDS:1, partial [Racocetra fulgida]